MSVINVTTPRTDLVRVEGTVRDATPHTRVEISIYDPNNVVVASAKAQGASFHAELKIREPMLWDIDSPNLYRFVVRVLDGRKKVEESTDAFPIRQFKFDPATGYWLNGRNLKLHGVVLRREGGAWHRWEPRLSLLKQFGANAVDFESEPDPGINHLCDGLGLLVVDRGSENWPSFHDLFDHIDDPRPSAYQRASLWSSQPMVHIVRTPQKDTVQVYSNCDEVALYLDRRLLSTLPRPADDLPRAWKVGLEPASLNAICLQGNKPLARHELRTAGEPARIELAAETWGGYSYVFASIVDSDNVLVPDASNLVQFGLQGTGSLIAVENGDEARDEPFQNGACRAFHGRCLAVVSGHGAYTVTAISPGLTPAEIRVE